MRTGFDRARRNEMALRLRRRSVYVATIVAILAMVGGFALASIPNGFTSSSTGNQNSGTVVSAGNTQYSGGFTVTLVTLTPQSGGCGTSGTVTGGGTTNVNVLLYTGSTCPQTNEWYEEVSFSLASVATGVTHFYIDTVDSSGPGSSGLITITDTAATGAATLNFYLDYGSSGAAMTSISSISIAVTGT